MARRGPREPFRGFVIVSSLPNSTGEKIYHQVATPRRVRLYSVVERVGVSVSCSSCRSVECDHCRYVARLSGAIQTARAEWDRMQSAFLAEQQREYAQDAARRVAAPSASSETPAPARPKRRRRTKAEMAAWRAEQAAQDRALTERVVPPWLREHERDLDAFVERMNAEAD